VIYVVLGMHKSGTSLISRILHHSGINMVDESDEDAAKGKHYDKYERQPVLAVNQGILNAEGLYSLNINPPDSREITGNQRRQMQEIIYSCEKQYDNWGFKEPRTCLTYPFWDEELPEHKLIAIYRSPYELAPRARAHLFPHRAWKLVKRWYEYNTRILTYLRNTRMHFIVFNYRELMTDDSEFKRLCDFIGKDLNDQREIDFYRHKPAKYITVKTAEWLFRKKTGNEIKNIDEQLHLLKK